MSSTIVLDEYATIGYTKIRNLLETNPIFDLPLNVDNIFRVTKFKYIRENIYGDLEKLSYLINTDHIVIKSIIENLEYTLTQFKILEEDGIKFRIKKQFRDYKNTYYFSNVKINLTSDINSNNLLNQIRVYGEIQIALFVKLINDRYIEKNITFTPIILLKNQYDLADALLRFAYKDNIPKPIIDKEIQLTSVDYNSAIYIKEITNCLLYALSYNNIDINNNTNINTMKTLITDYILEKQNLPISAI